MPEPPPSATSRPSGLAPTEVQSSSPSPGSSPSADGSRISTESRLPRVVVESSSCHAGACQQQRLVEALAVDRLGADALSVGGHGGFARLAAL